MHRLLLVAASAAKQTNKVLSSNPDDYYIHLFNLGWEGIGHWDAEALASNLAHAGKLISRESGDEKCPQFQCLTGRCFSF